MLDINQLFNERYYLSANPDVANAVKSGSFKTGLDHFNQFGASENRDPSFYFNTDYYLKQNPAVATAVKQGQITAIDHFIRYGQTENRDPLTEFDTSYYLKNNTEVNNTVTASKSTKDPLTGYEHFVKFGQFEERDASERFYSQPYLKRYAGVGDAVKSDKQLSAFNHYLQYGKKEGLARLAKANSIAFNILKQDANNLDPTLGNSYNCSKPPASDPTGYGPIYGEQCNSLPNTTKFGGPINTALDPEYFTNSSLRGNNIYNDTPYYESKISWITRNEDPNLIFDVANTKSDLFSSITQTSPHNMTVSGGGIPPGSWFKLVRVWTGLASDSEKSGYDDQQFWTVGPS